jgi:hypothetical protein
MTQPRRTSPEPGAEIACPFCASTETELFALFGQFLLASQYYCRSCKTVFDVVRWRAPVRPTQAEDDQTHPAGLRPSKRDSSRDEAG